MLILNIARLNATLLKLSIYKVVTVYVRETGRESQRARKLPRTKIERMAQNEIQENCVKYMF